MVVVDSSALIPLAWIWRLDLASTAFEDVKTTEAVREEVLMEGIAETDASVILLAKETRRSFSLTTKA